MVMANNDDHSHTDEEHAAMSEIAAKAIGEALAACVTGNVCSAVMLDEMIHALVAGAVTQEFSLGDLVGDLIDEYYDVTEAMKTLKRALEGSERKTRAH
jgi:hypothetical protein